MISQMARKRPGVTWVAVISTLQLLSIAARVGDPVQPLLGVIFALTCPGFLLLDLDQPRELSARVMLGIGGSIAANIVVVNVVLATDAGPIAPFIAVVLAGAAALPRRRLEAAISRTQKAWRQLLGNGSPQLAVAEETAPADGETAVVAPQPEPEPEAEPEREVEPESEPEPEPSGPPSVVVLGVDINQAGPGPLAGLPGIGTELAERIVAYRDEHGPFEDVHALLDVLRGFAIEEEAGKI